MINEKKIETLIKEFKQLPRNEQEGYFLLFAYGGGTLIGCFIAIVATLINLL